MNRRADERKVRKLIAQRKRGKTLAFADVLRVCPYRSLLVRHNRALAEPAVVVGVLGFECEDFSHDMRAEILAAIDAGETVLLVSNNMELRNYATREILLAGATPQGAA